jgi:hypothetical protein
LASDEVVAVVTVVQEPVVVVAVTKQSGVVMAVIEEPSDVAVVMEESRVVVEMTKEYGAVVVVTEESSVVVAVRKESSAMVAMMNEAAAIATFSPKNWIQSLHHHIQCRACAIGCNNQHFSQVYNHPSLKGAPTRFCGGHLLHYPDVSLHTPLVLVDY